MIELHEELTSYTDYSQCGEGRIIANILRLLPDSDGWCVEFGASDGKQNSNTRHLVESFRYSAVLIESDPAAFEALRANYHPTEWPVFLLNRRVGFEKSDSLDTILKWTPIPADFDLLSIDIDGNDYHAWSTVEEFRPKVVCIEFNASIPTGMEFIQPADHEIRQGSSISSIVGLAQRKGYKLVAVTSFNAIFVDAQYYPLLGIENNSPQILRADLSRITYVAQDGNGGHFIGGNGRFVEAPAVTKLNLGSGETSIDGFENRDGALGDCIFPLPDPDASMEVIRASHVLEHFPGRQVQDVIKDWVRALKPGGTLKIAVPNFKLIAEQYVSGATFPVGAYVLGAQTDERDFHKALFDESTLASMMRDAGLISIRRWKSEIDDCAALPVSLNLAGTKPMPFPKVAAVISMPRLGFNDFWSCAYQSLSAFRIPIRKSSGPYWDRDLVRGIEQSLEEYDPEWILTCDYDTIFTPVQVADLLSLAARYPHADAIAPLQTARWHNAPMFTIRHPKTGELIPHVEREILEGGEILRAETAHFGLTLLRASAMKELPKPWFKRQFSVSGDYDGEGALDPDVNFWHHWKQNGKTLYIALRVPVGHCELTVRWPDINLDAATQLPGEFWKSGPPPNVWR